MTEAKTVYANAGEEITCENGHTYGHFTRDVLRGSVMSSADFVYADGTKPKPSSTVRRCEQCGARAIRMGLGPQAHFKDGWRSFGHDGA